MHWIALQTSKRTPQGNCTTQKRQQVHAIRHKEDPTSSSFSTLQYQSNAFSHRHPQIVYLRARQAKPHKHSQQTKHTGAQGTLAFPLPQLSIHDCTARATAAANLPLLIQSLTACHPHRATCPHPCPLFKMHLGTVVLPSPRTTLPLRTIQHVPHRHKIHAPTTETTNSTDAANACIPTASSIKYQKTSRRTLDEKQARPHEITHNLQSIWIIFLLSENCGTECAQSAAPVRYPWQLLCAMGFNAALPLRLVTIHISASSTTQQTPNACASFIDAKPQRANNQRSLPTLRRPHDHNIPVPAKAPEATQNRNDNHQGEWLQEKSPIAFSSAPAHSKHDNSSTQTTSSYNQTETLHNGTTK